MSVLPLDDRGDWNPFRVGCEITALADAGRSRELEWHGVAGANQPHGWRELVSAGVLLLELLNSMALVKVDLSGQGRITMKSEVGY